ncbi:MAG: type I DNA topoisomerase [Candidatus Absconditabacterales bacterium]|nr:type I DNA topoisomerase [Candidatus Absconditabacterales bacterium]
MASHLVIVESPAKASTIEKYLGSDYHVLASFGHIADLPKKGMGIDIDNNFTPTYEITPEKRKVVSHLKSAAKQAQTIWIATDEDREGEAIGWHICTALGLDPTTTKRIVFNEITKSAIIHAINHPRTLDLNLFNAQQARRILDRLVGFEVSPVLWRKIKTGLSAGRVQSVAVRILVDREREIRAFVPDINYKITATVGQKKQQFTAERNKKITDETAVREILSRFVDHQITVLDVVSKEGTKKPSPPFTTSSLQQTASSKLGYSPKKTMQLAQRLYEAGLITYMRTDSIAMASEAREKACSQISSQFGPEYVNETVYKTTKQSAQEAHECIRPTDFSRLTAGSDPQQTKLYQLIRKRAIASQMKPALLAKSEIHLGRMGDVLEKPHFVAKGEIVSFPGFLVVRGQEDNETLLPDVQIGQSLPLDSILAIQTPSKAPARYTEASLIKQLEDLGIGRPSTYAPTIETIQNRGYVVKQDVQGVEKTYQTLTLSQGHILPGSITKVEGADKGKLLPTDIGTVVNDFLVEYLPEIVDYQFTAIVEAEFDHIAEGKLAWTEMLARFYRRFHSTIVKTIGEAERVSGERKIGTDPKTGLTVIARLGRYGPLVQLGTSEELGDKKPQFASITGGLTIETLTLESALKMFELPRVIGEFESKPMLANNGRFGPYIKHGDVFVSMPAGYDPMTIDADTAIQAILDKREKDKTKILLRFDYQGTECQIIRGRWGYYLSYGKQPIKLPKTKKPEEYSVDDCIALIVEYTTQFGTSASGEGKTRSAKKTTGNKRKTTAKKKISVKK